MNSVSSLLPYACEPTYVPLGQNIGLSLILETPSIYKFVLGNKHKEMPRLFSFKERLVRYIRNVYNNLSATVIQNQEEFNMNSNSREYIVLIKVHWKKSLLSLI